VLLLTAITCLRQGGSESDRTVVGSIAVEEGDDPLGSDRASRGGIGPCCAAPATDMAWPGPALGILTGRSK